MVVFCVEMEGEGQDDTEWKYWKGGRATYTERWLKNSVNKLEKNLNILKQIKASNTTHSRVFDR